MTVCAQAAGIDIPYISGNAPYTGNMQRQFTSTGYFKVLKTKQHLTTDTYLERGDILIRTSGHTAMALENGSAKTSNKSTNNTTDKTTGGACSVTLNTLSKGMTGAQVKAMQLLLIGYGCDCGKRGADGDFGEKTKSALITFQITKNLTPDGICGTNTWNKLLKG